jgi:hypothetical protein
VHEDLVAGLLPSLVGRAEEPFNVFRVMRHGTHEKQLSNVFAWLLDAEGTHRLGDVFQRIFIEEVSRRPIDARSAWDDAFSVRQEVDVSASGDGSDIADIVLESHETCYVVENYQTSDGHDHGFENYRRFGAAGGKSSVVVMLCQIEIPTALEASGWNDASVVTYGVLLDRLQRHIASDGGYQLRYPEQCVFLAHMHRRFVGGRRVNDESLIGFLDAMCRTGEVERFRGNKQEDAAISFGDHLREEAVRQYGETLELTKDLKRKLKAYCAGMLRPQVNAALGVDLIDDRYYTDYASIWKWTVGLYRTDAPQKQFLQLKIGPSAWYANERKEGDFTAGEWWETTVPPTEADYTRIFLTWPLDKSVHQTEVTLLELREGLEPDDYRLRDQVLALVRSSA